MQGLRSLQALELPSLLAQGRQLAVLSLAAMGLCIVLGWLLAATPDGVGRKLWHAVAGTAALVLAGWAISRGVSSGACRGPRQLGVDARRLVTGVLAAVCLGVAIVAAPPTGRPSAASRRRPP